MIRRIAESVRTTGAQFEKDIHRLKPLAEKSLELSRKKENIIKNKRWNDVNEHIKPDSIPIYTMLDESAWQEIVPETALKCETHEARWLEQSLKRHLFLNETDDDTPLSDTLYINALMKCDPPQYMGSRYPIGKAC